MSDFVPLDLLEEDHDAFAVWDAENPDPEANRRADIARCLKVAAELLDRLGVYAGRNDLDAGQNAHSIVMGLRAVALELRGLGYDGSEANVERYDEAIKMLRASIDEERERRRKEAERRQYEAMQPRDQVWNANDIRRNEKFRRDTRLKK